MADLLRRILWLIPVLVAGAVVTFFVFGSTRSVAEHLERPLFYNPAPVSAQVAAREALQLAMTDPPAGARRMEELGGAALPIVLEELPRLSVKNQRLVAASLQGVEARFQIRDKEKWTRGNRSSKVDENADQALLFWERYRDEHALDLRPLAASRLVKRAAQRDAPLQNADLLAVDTFALPLLIDALGRIRTSDDVVRARRVIRAIAHATREPWELPEHATVEQARKVSTQILQYWDERGGQWTQLDRFELLVARFSQTEFASWVFRSVRQITGLDHPELLNRFAAKSRTSVPLGAFCLLGLLVIGPALAAAIQVLQLRQSRWRIESLGIRAGLATGVVALLPLLVGRAPPDWGRLCFLSVTMGTVVSVFMLQREISDRLDWRTHHVLRQRPGLRRVGAVVRWLAPSVPTLTPIAVAEAAMWVTCLEAGSRSGGLGFGALEALRNGDLDFLMALALSLGLVTGTAQILADLLLGTGQVRQGET